MAKAKKEAPKKEPKGKKSMADMMKSYQKDKDYRDMFHDPNTAKNIECIDSGSYIVNKILGLKGIAKGRMGEIYGYESSGKTTLVQAIALSVLEKKGKVLYFDYEHAFDTEYAKELGLDVDNPDHFQLIRPDNFEQGWGICRDYLDNVADIDLIIIDSMAAMTPKAIMEMSIDKHAQIGLHARMCSQFCAEITKKISRSNTAMIVVNQVRNRIKGPYDPGPDTTTTGGNAIKFYFSWRLELQKIGMMTKEGVSEVDGSDEDKPIGIRIQVKNIKNKLATPFLKSSIVVRFKEGIDNVESIIDICINKKFIKKDGAWFGFTSDINTVEDAEYIADTGTIQGRESLREYLVKHESVYGQLVQKVMADAIEREVPVKEETTAEVAPDVEAVDAATEAVLAAEAQKASSKRGKKKKEAEAPVAVKEEELA